MGEVSRAELRLGWREQMNHPAGLDHEPDLMLIYFQLEIIRPKKRAGSGLKPIVFFENY